MASLLFSFIPVVLEEHLFFPGQDLNAVFNPHDVKVSRNKRLQQ